ncbi:MAG: TonB-dependent receptor [Bradyrhizobium sp.]|nr:TonB-dependent receptor [Bradyrhizobium sp.]
MRIQFLGSVAVAAIMMSGSAVQAQTTAAGATTQVDQDGSGLEEIVVTAQRRAENLQDVPVAVTALTSNSLASKGISNTTDLGSVTPGLSYSTVVGSALPRIRGIGSAISLGGNENPVATYIDGVYIASAAASVLSFNNIEQVAVLKGPQGTLFGRNATGGLIQITTRDPQQAFAGEASATYGNLDTIGGTAYLTGGLAENLAADLAVFYNDQRDGFGRNLTTGSEINKARDFAARSKIKLSIGNDTTIRLALDYAHTRAAAPAFRPIYGSLPITGLPFTGGKFDIANETDPSLVSEQGGGSLSVTHNFGAINLLSITAYRKTSFHTLFDIDKLPAFISRSDLNQPQHQFSQELQLQSKGRGPFRWVVGGYYFNSSASYDPLVISTVPSDLIISSTQKTESIAAFGQASYEFAPKTTITIGLRYTDENKDYQGQGVVALRTGVTTINPAIFGTLKARKLTWRAALDHHFTDTILGYISYNRGFKSGGFNPQQFAQPLTPFQPEVLDAGEAGLKMELLDRHLRLNTAGFYYKYKNIQINAFQNGISTIYNAASATIYGFDLDATAVATRNLSFTLGASWLHDRYGDFPGAVISTPRVPNGTTILGGNATAAGNAEGNRLSLTPDWTLNLGADYVIPLPNGSINLSANFFHSDGWRAEPDNRIGQKPYNLVNASATWLFGPNRDYSVKLFAKNIGNVAYAVQMNAQPQADGVAIGAGRTYGVTLGVKF